MTDARLHRVLTVLVLVCGAAFIAYLGIATLRFGQPPAWYVVLAFFAGYYLLVLWGLRVRKRSRQSAT